MTKMRIAQKLCPFSHEKGVRLLVPHTSVCVRIFPTRLEWEDLEGKVAPSCMDFGWMGPVKEFTAQLDLERGRVVVFGFSREGFFRYFLEAEEKGVWLKWDKIPKGSALRAERIPLRSVYFQVNSERLSLGSHKAQDLTLMRRREDPVELFPIWVRLGSMVPSIPSPERREGNYLLLDKCKELLKEREKILEALLCFYLAAFEDAFVPRVFDAQYQGLGSLKPSSPLPTLPLLTESAHLVRSLFYQERGKDEIALLPSLPPPFHCGRMIHVKSPSGQTLHFEWSKKKLREVWIESPIASSLALWLPKGIFSCRLKNQKRPLTALQPLRLDFKAHERVILDRFS